MGDLVFPQVCAGCGDGEVERAGLCLLCRRRLLADRGALRLGPPICGGWVLGAYGGILRDRVRVAKYRADPGIARCLGKWMACLVTARVDLVTPVPTRWTKQLSRGFDVVRTMSVTVAGELNCPHGSILRRQDRGSQVGRTRGERRALDPDAFVVKRTDVPRVVLLVDDVVTTGTTLRLCAARLLDAGAEQVWVLAAAHRK